MLGFILGVIATATIGVWLVNAFLLMLFSGFGGTPQETFIKALAWPWLFLRSLWGAK